MTRRDFGSVRKLPSGRWPARHHTPDGVRVPASGTFATRAEAAGYLAGVQADQDRATWLDLVASNETLRGYATSWLAQRADLRPRTAELYGGLLARHLLPQLGQLPLHRLSPAIIRKWHAGRLEAGVGRSTVAKAYRLLKTILSTAVVDEVLARNPCLLRGAGTERPPSGCRPPCCRHTSSPRPFSRAGACSSCWPPGRGCAGVSWSHCAAAASTLRAGA